MLILLISEATSLYQLAKLPSLYRHFIEHKTLSPTVSFTEYLSMHYWGQDLNDDDDEKDMQLPFKKFDIHTPVFLFVAFDKSFAIKPEYWPVNLDFARDRLVVYFSPEQNSLFRPPRV
ncbi:hypothetical protein [Olivibacter jilunii]|uniref:hypothetical protein n=1 Tax=Olivibacter jilunii TaxID=985016 RepID=UPI003F174EBA